MDESLLLIGAVLGAVNVATFGLLAWVNRRYPARPPAHPAGRDVCPDCRVRIRFDTPAGRADAHLLHRAYDCSTRSVSGSAGQKRGAR